MTLTTSLTKSLREVFTIPLMFWGLVGITDGVGGTPTLASRAFSIASNATTPKGFNGHRVALSLY